MNEIIYLEPESEITSVIDRIKNAESTSVALVIPRGGTLAQSIVNLKLLKKSAEDLKKEISLVANDRISRNLASQIGLTVYSKVSEAAHAAPKKAVTEKSDGNDDIKVNNYYRNKDQEGEDEEAIEEEIEATNEEEETHGVETGVNEEVAESSFEALPDDIPNSKEEEAYADIEENAEEEEDETVEEKKPVPADYRKKHNNLKSSRKPILIFGSIGLVLILVASFILLPYASASIELKTEDYETELSVVADRAQKETDKSKLMIPSQLVEIEKEESEEFASTGKKDVGEKAAGTLTFSNNAGVADSLAAGSTVKSAGGVEFTLDQAITMPKATASVNANGEVQLAPGKATGKVTAKKSGADSNLPSNTYYSVSGKALINAVGETSGGVTKELKVVTEADLEKAAKSLNTKIAENAKTDLIKKAQEGSLSILETEIKSEVISENASKKAGEEAEKFNYTSKIKYFVLGFSNKDLNSLVQAAVADKIGGDKMVVNPENADINYKITESNVNEGTLSISSTFKGKVGGKLEKKEVIDKIKNKSVEKAKSQLKENENISNVEINTWPSFYSRIPLLKNRIKVDFNYSK